MTAPPGLVIFDCDGVLVDSERLAVRVDVEVIRELGLEISEAEVVELFVGRSDDDMRRGLGELLGRELGADWDAPFAERYRRALEAELTAVDGVDRVIEALHAHGVPTCVASSGTHDKMQFTLGHTGLWAHFEGRIFSATEVGRGKPAPDLFLHAARAMGTEPGACVVIEDSRAGVEAGVAAGMRVYAFAGGVTPRERLALPGVDLFDAMAELVGRLLG